MDDPMRPEGGATAFIESGDFLQGSLVRADEEKGAHGASSYLGRCTISLGGPWGYHEDCIGPCYMTMELNM